MMCLDGNDVGTMILIQCLESSIFWLTVPIDSKPPVNDQLMAGFSTHVNSLLLFRYRKKYHLFLMVTYDKLLSVE